MTKPDDETLPRIDLPEAGRVLTAARCSVRVSDAEDAEDVDVSIDGGPWLPCLRSAGRWRLEWSGYGEGEHALVARRRGRHGRWLVSAPLRVTARPRPPRGSPPEAVDLGAGD